MTHDMPTLEEEVSQEDLLERLNVPLNLLRSVSGRLLRREIPLSKDRLDDLYAHIRSAMGEVLDFAHEQVQGSIARLAEATEVLEEGADDPDLSDAITAVLADFEVGREQIESGLAMIKETFFSASSFTELEAAQDSLVVAEAQIEEGFAQLETALLRTEDPELLEIGQSPVKPEVANALDFLADGLEDLRQHLEDGTAQPIRDALKNLDRSRELLVQALDSLEQAPPEEE